MTQRWIAYKMNIKDITENHYSEEGFLVFGQVQVQRVRVAGSVVQKFIADDDKYGFFILDDGTETIRIRSFQDSIDLIKQVEIGDLVDVFGRLRQYEEEIYVIPEIVKKIDDPNMYFLRKLELKKQSKKMNAQPAEKTSDEKTSPAVHGVEDDVIEEVLETRAASKEKSEPKQEEQTTPRRKVVDCIARYDRGEGVEIGKLTTGCGLPEDIVEKVLTELMNEGEIFEPRAGKVKILG